MTSYQPGTDQGRRLQPYIMDCPRTFSFGFRQALPQLLKVDLQTDDG
jgi:hypothetical protein